MNFAPSDFGKFIYCEFKWLYESNSNFIKKQFNSNPKTIKQAARLFGQNNEHLCVQYVINKYKLDDNNIIYNGINSEVANILIANFEELDIEVQCKPDFIFKKNDITYLFEFKSVSDRNYLYYSPYNSVFAQIWCYTKLKDIEIDEYHLLRYYVDPMYFKNRREYLISNGEISDLEFEKLFIRFVSTKKVIDYANKLSKNERERYILNNYDYKNQHKPSSAFEIESKCKSCILNKKEICDVYRKFMINFRNS